MLAINAAPSITSVRRRRASVPDLVAISVLVALVPIVHDLGAMLGLPYWNDEAWVALSTQLPVADLRLVTAVTPPGWTLLLRLVPSGDHLRLVPLAFLVLTVVAAYVLGRLVWAGNRAISVAAGLVCGTAVVVMPAQQFRHDLKQYTADAALTLILYGLCLSVERAWRSERPARARLFVLAGVAGAGTVFSYASAAAGVCVFVGLFLVALVRRRVRPLVETTIAGAVAALLMGITYVTLVVPNRSPWLDEYWAADFPTLSGLPGYLSERAPALAPYLGLPLKPALLLAGLGIAAIAARGWTGTAIGATGLPVVMVILGVTKIYPLLDLRTSHFLLVAVLVFAALGLVAVAVVAARMGQRVWHRLPVVPATCVLLALALGSITVHNHDWFRLVGRPGDVATTPMATQDMRTTTRYVWEHRQPGDQVLVNVGARYGFVFYWPRGPRQVVPVPGTTGWYAALPGQHDITLITRRDLASISQALDGARARAPRASVWVVVSQFDADELRALHEAFRAGNYDVHQVPTGGIEPLFRLTPRPGA